MKIHSLKKNTKTKRLLAAMLSVIMVATMVFTGIPAGLFNTPVYAEDTPVGGLVVTTTADSGDGSLRAAVEAAQDGDVITFDLLEEDGGYNDATGVWTITLSAEIAYGADNPAITIIAPQTDDGKSAVAVSGNNTCRVLRNDGGGLLTLNNLYIKDGNTAEYGGGINTNGSITAINCVFTDNYSPKLGGGFYTKYFATLKNCTFLNNSAGAIGGGLLADRGVTATGCVFSGNYGGYLGGGGVYSDGPITLANCFFTGNKSATNFDGSVHGGYDVRLFHCTLTENITTGVYSDFGKLYLYNSIIAGNTKGQTRGEAGKNTSLIENGDTNTYASIFGNNSVTFGYLMPLPTAANIKAAAPVTTANLAEAGITNADEQTAILNALKTDIAGKPRGETACTYGAVEATAKTWTVTNNDSGTSLGSLRNVAGLVNADTATPAPDCHVVTFDKNMADSAGSGNANEIKPGDYPVFSKNTIVYGRLDADGKPEITIDGDDTYRPLTFDGIEGSVYGLNILKGTAGFGGGVYAKGSLYVHSCTFTGNTATDSGGGVYAYSGSATATDCTFTGNTANIGGGVYAGGSVTATGCTFTENKANNGSGGAIRAQKDADITDSAFTGNTASDNGGGVYSNLGDVTATGCTFTGNTAKYGYGGGVYAGDSAKATGCTFTENKAIADSGGAIRARTSADVIDSVFTGNTASNNGGGVFANDGNVTATGCTFTGNAASNYGGAIEAGSNDIFLTLCSFSGNTSIFGGAVDTEGKVTAKNCVFTSNEATVSGGCIYATDIEVESSTFTENSATEGGGVYASGSMAATGCTFTGNTASNNGGGVFANNGSVTAVNSIFTKNTSNKGDDSGGVIDANKGIHLFHCTIADNLGESVGAFSHVGYIYAYNSIIVNNQGGETNVAITGGDSLIGDINSVTRETVFGVNKTGADGYLRVLGGGLADGTAVSLVSDDIKEAGITEPEETTLILTTLQDDLAGVGRIGYSDGSQTTATTYGALENPEDSIASIAVTTNPTKMNYALNEPIGADPFAGGELTYTYTSGGTDSNDNKIALNSPLVTSSPALSTAAAGTKTITFTYLSKSCTLDISVGKGTPAIITEPTASPVWKGSALPALTGGEASVGGDFEWLVAGNVTETKEHGVIFTPADTANYNSVSLNITVTVIDKDALVTLVAAANAAKNGATVGAGNGQYTQAAYDTFAAAVKEAEGFAKGSAPASQTAVTDEINALQAALTTFNGAANAVDNGELAALITTATAKMNGSTYGLRNGDYAPAQEAALGNAITAAQAVADKADRTPAEVTGAISDLQTAINNFNATLVVVSYTALNDLVSSCNTIHDGALEGDGQYESGSKAVFKAAITVAENTAADTRATQAEVDEAVSTLTAARNTFAAKKVGVNYDVLIALITQARDKADNSVYSDKNGDYPESAKKPLTDAIEQAQLVADNNTATQAAVDSAVSQLQAAINAFNDTKINVNYQPLKDLLDTAKNIKSGATEGNGDGQYPTAAMNALQTAIDTAQTTADDNYLSQQTVNDAYTALNDAIAAFNAAKVSVDNKPLSDTVKEAEDILKEAEIGSKPGQYPQDAADKLEEAIEKAKEVLDDPDSSQDDIDKANEDLQNAVDEFEDSEIPTDSKPLSDTVKEAEDILKEAEIGSKPGQYPQDAADKLEEAIEKAKEILDDPNATQAEKDKARQDLLEAIEAFENSKIPLSPPTGDNSNVLLWILLCAASLFISAVLIVVSKKRRYMAVKK